MRMMFLTARAMKPQSRLEGSTITDSFQNSLNKLIERAEKQASLATRLELTMLLDPRNCWPFSS